MAYGTAYENSYILGKALYNPEHNGIVGLSEFLDLEIYKRMYDKGVKYVNIGGSSTKSLKAYKKKFPGCFELKEYHGVVNEV